MKTFHCLLIPVYWSWALVAATPGGAGTFPRRVAGTVLSHGRRWLVFLVAPSAACFALILVVNRWKFGSIFNLGYGQYQENGASFDRFSLEFLPQALAGFFLTVKWNPFLHFPLLPLALIGAPAFWRRFRPEALLILAIAAVGITGVSLHRGWNGEWCYGPRHLFCFLPLLSLPFIETLRLVRARLPALPARLAAMGIAGVLAISTWLQVWVNAVQFFAYHQLKFTMAQAHDPEVDRYFDDYHLALVAADLIDHRRGRRPFPPLAILDRRGSLTPDQREVVDATIEHESQSNYFFFPSPPTRREVARRAWIAAQEGKLETAVEHLRAVQAMPGDPRAQPADAVVHLWLGGILGRLGRLYEAVSELDRALQAQPAMAPDVLRIAEAWAQGHPTEAIVLLRVIVNRVPASAEARSRLQQLDSANGGRSEQR